MDDALKGEVEEPRVGTLAWLQAQGTVERDGVTLPACHRVPTDATLAAPSDSPKCRVTSADGERCKGTRLIAYGVCMGHAGGGGSADLDAMREKGVAKLKSLKATRQLLGIGPSRVGDPRSVMRLRAAQRASELAQAVVDGPLDDRKLGTVERQRAALAALDATYPLQTASLTLSIDEPDDMDWKSMQALAISLES